MTTVWCVTKLFGMRFKLCFFKRIFCFVLLFRLYHSTAAVQVIGWSVTVPERHSATLFCKMIDTKEDLTRITWQKRTRQRPENKNFFAITPNGQTEHLNGLGDRVGFTGNIPELDGSIVLSNVSLQDEGVYTCIFNIFPSGPFERELTLTVLVPPVVSVTPLMIPVAGDGNVTVATCTAAKARPAAQVSWLLGDLNTSVKVQTNQSQHPDGTYTVTSHLIGVASKELNQQKVQCLVNHTTLNTILEVDYTVVIHYPPQIAYIFSVGKATEAQEFLCEADANPKPTIFTWRRMNQTLSDNDRLLIPLTSDHNGLYVCEASNQYGSVKGSVYVHVDRESIIGTIFLILFIIFLIIVCGGVFWYRETLHTRLSLLWQRIRHPNSDPVPTQPPTQDSPSGIIEEVGLASHDQVVLPSPRDLP